MYRLTMAACLAALGLCGAVSAQVFEDRTQVNILRGLDVTVTAKTNNGDNWRNPDNAPLFAYGFSSFRMLSRTTVSPTAIGDPAFFGYGVYGPYAMNDSNIMGGLPLAWEFDFGVVQNVQTIRVQAFYRSSDGLNLGFTSAKVYTSSDGINWNFFATADGAYSGGEGSYVGSLTLKDTGGNVIDTDTRYMKVEPITSSRVFVHNFGVYGSAGAMDGVQAAKLDLISSAGLASGSGGGPAVAINSSKFPVSGSTFADFANQTSINGNQSIPLSAAGDWITVTFQNGLVYEFEKFAVMTDNFAYMNEGATFRLDVFTPTDLDGDLSVGSWSTVLANASLPVRTATSEAFAYFDLPAGTIGTEIRITLLDAGTPFNDNNGAAAWAGKGSNYINDLQLFGHVYDPIPEPATMTLLALGGVAMLRRK